MDKLFDPQFLIFAGLTCATVLITLIVLAVVSRRVRLMASEVQSLKREIGLLDDSLQTLSRMGRPGGDSGDDE